ncbi:hypothetical protein PtA15_6A299 [Puccinia triticina]|uniref:Uncharacterized protein n=1 Tax=Puccinia triticina TaxID=208348 RepID=A0ABY7CKB6_9BASI|nr:uncharacterized protein PtA15_6A299 [Puccinia triticina]WAQ85671.1 hypothetical protein PtA15_6A299 [Puccinia triticina]
MSPLDRPEVATQRATRPDAPSRRPSGDQAGGQHADARSLRVPAGVRMSCAIGCRPHVGLVM